MPAWNKPAAERRNLSPAALYEHAIRRGEAVIVSTGALTAETGKHTGRSPKDKFFVREPTSQGAIWWEANQAIAPAKFDALVARMDEFCATHEVFTHDLFACADHRHLSTHGTACSPATCSSGPTRMS
jgi:phosphoenolpyruvate carboxykinase (ATP)